jgi:hypothetical protein
VEPILFPELVVLAVLWFLERGILAEQGVLDKLVAQQVEVEVEVLADIQGMAVPVVAMVVLVVPGLAVAQVEALAVVGDHLHQEALAEA